VGRELETSNERVQNVLDCTISLFSQAMENWHLAFQDHFPLLSNPHHHSSAAFANQMAQILVDSMHIYLSRRRLES
jgi:hypothetical protein